MAVEWVLTGKALYDNRDSLLSLWERIANKILGPKSRVAFVGPGGIGKTVLFDHMTGKAFKKGYKVPAKSRKKDVGGIRADGNRLGLVVSPGQGGPKADTFDHIFDSNNPVDGIVFVAGAGFVTLRDATAMEVAIKGGNETISKWRKTQLTDEIEYLRDTLTRMRVTQKKFRRPRWALVAVTKLDLYTDEIEEIKNYYSPHLSSPFSSLLNEFQSSVGSDNFEWEAVPVCSLLDDFVWGEEIAASSLTEVERDSYLSQFIVRLGELCHD